VGYLADESLLVTMSNEFSAISGLKINPDNWDESRIDKHLRFNIQVLEQGRMLAESRSLTALKQQFGSKARKQFMRQEGQEWHRDNLQQWDFGELAETVLTPGGSKAWPALVDQQTAVGIRLFDNSAEAAYEHQQGLQRLLLLSLKDKLKYLRKNSGIQNTAAMIYLALAEDTSLEPAEDLLQSVLVDLLSGFGRVRDEAAFSKCLAGISKDWVPECARLSKVFNQVMTAYQAASLAVDDELATKYPEVWEDASSQLADLVYAGFLADVQAPILRHYPRYLEAVSLRLQRLTQDPQKDAKRQAQIQPWWQRYLDYLEAAGDYTNDLDYYRWLLEEYRVSLFAKDLGTRQKVSEKRLEEAWESVDSI
jgi:ATP-dependent helicase HrpA